MNSVVCRAARSVLFVSVAGLALCASQAAVAGDSQPSSASAPVATPGPAASTPAAANTGPVLDTVVVTAQRRSENLERTPVSVTAISAADLKKESISTESDLQNATSGLLVRQSLTSNQIDYAIRGQSIDAYSSSQPGVLPYFDEVQQDAHAASEFYDLQSIQVLKGPQGTLFGRNATGGAVLITSAKPGDQFGGYITAQGGNYGYTDAQGAVNLPIVPDKVLLRVAGDYEHRSGYVHDVYANTTPGTVVRDAARISLELKPVAHVTNLTVLDFVHSGGSNAPSEIYSAYGPGSTHNGVPLSSSAATLFSPFLDTAIGFPGAFAAYVAANPGANPLGLLNAAQQQRTNGPYTTDVSGDFTHRSDNTIVSNVTTIDIAPNTQIKNIFGFDRADTFDLENSSGAPYIIDATQPSGDHYDTTDYSEELQLLGKALGDQLTYVTGFYYLNDSSYEASNVVLFDLAPIIPGTNVSYIFGQSNVSYAGYAQGTYDLSQFTGISGLSFTGGLRYTKEDVSAKILPGSVYYQVPGLLSNLEQSQSKLSWQIGAQEQLNPNLLLYVVSRHSFRSGGFNADTTPAPGNASAGGPEFGPETTTDVEIGQKYQGHIGAIPFRLNADVYNQWVDNAQRADYLTVDGILSVLTINVPKVEISGFEADGQIKPTEWLNLGISAAYNDARYTDGKAIIFGQTTVFGPAADTPRWSGSAFAEVSKALPNDLGTASVRGDVFAQSSFFFSNLSNTVTPETQIPGYGLLNFRVAVDNIKDTGVSIAGYVKNALDKGYYAGGIPSGNAIGLNVVQPGSPRMFYGEVNYKF